MGHIFDKNKTSAMNLNSGKTNQKGQLYVGNNQNSLLLPHAPGAMSNNKYPTLNYGPQQSQKNKDRYI